jgi:hypothetical protein
MMKKLSWHPGAGVFAKTVEKAFIEIVDTLTISILMMGGFGMTSCIWFGALSGDENFQNLPTSIGSIGQISFGLYEYDDYMSWGHGIDYTGLGLGEAQWTKVFIFWIMYVILSIIIVNILIAAVGVGFESYKKQVEQRYDDRITFLTYLWRRLVFLIWYGKLGLLFLDQRVSKRIHSGFKKLEKGLKEKEWKEKLKDKEYYWPYRMQVGALWISLSTLEKCYNPMTYALMSHWVQDWIIRFQIFEGKNAPEKHLISREESNEIFTNNITDPEILWNVIFLLLSFNKDKNNENEVKENNTRRKIEDGDVVKIEGNLWKIKDARAGELTTITGSDCIRLNIKKKDLASIHETEAYQLLEACKSGSNDNIDNKSKKAIQQMTSYSYEDINDFVKVLWVIYREECTETVTDELGVNERLQSIEQKLQKLIEAAATKKID